MPIGGDPNGPILEGWTLLSALAAHTERLRVGLLVTSNRFRPPAMLAKIAATVDVVSGGRLDFGIGVGSRPSHPLARPRVRRARPAVPRHRPRGRKSRRGVHCHPALVDGGRNHSISTAPTQHLTGAFGNPKPVQRPHPPILIGGRSAPTLRVVAEHADLWNYPGDDIDDAVRRSAVLDRLCTEIGRAPASIARSMVLPVSYDRPRDTRGAIARAAEAGFVHIVLNLPAPYPEGVARWLDAELIAD